MEKRILYLKYADQTRMLEKIIAASRNSVTETRQELVDGVGRLHVVDANACATSKKYAPKPDNEDRKFRFVTP